MRYRSRGRPLASAPAGGGDPQRVSRPPGFLTERGEETGRLLAYRFITPSPKSTIVVFGGFDSYIEELIPTALLLRDAGYDVVAFDGPGQGAALKAARFART
jgi:alpha-beta hydrolase superfamily lysophospholipase